ncbi:MAG: PLP-dependent aminotransferase family protein [Alphaproteobacteria bacterium]|nr:PLP-dependent aminotransferase family protein [Alphaproteobacteria bacterium]
MIEILSSPVKNLNTSVIQDALQNISSDVISFSLGMPADNLFPILNFKEATYDLWRPSSFQYCSPLMELKYQIQKLMQQRGVSCTSSQIFLTNGAQQAIQLLCKALIDKDETVATDAAIYPGFIQAAQLSGIPLTMTSTSFSDGMDVDSLEALCQKPKKPKFIYTMSEGHNPLGISLSNEKRLKLGEMAQTYQIPIIEDDAYGFLNYQQVESPLKAYNSDWVFYIGSFSKILAPTTRVGWIIAPEFLIDKLAILKEGNDINTTTFSQRLISAFLDKNDFSAHLSLLREIYQEKRDKMVNALNKYIPEIKFIIPSSGFLIWAQLPKKIDANQLFWHALKNEKVSFLPGTAFSPFSENTLAHCLRLSFSYCPLELIETGVKRLANAIQSYPFNSE